MIDADLALDLQKKLISLNDMEKEITGKLPNNEDDWDIKHNPVHAHYVGLVFGLRHGASKIESFLGEHAFPKEDEADKEFRDTLKLAEEMFAEKDE